MKGRHSLYSYLACSLFLLLTALSTAQTITITNADEEVLIGVEVYTADYGFGATTNELGQVDLSSLEDRDAVLYFRFLGYGDRALSLAQIVRGHSTVILQYDDELLEEVVVLGRKSVSASEIPFQIATINQKAISSTNPQTSADALSQHGGVYVQKSQMGGGSPVIRGFEANRVLLVVDDIRMNNAIYRSGHLQNAITVDQAMLDRMEVVFGPNSLMYGSDALGGVVNFKTRSPILSQGPQSEVQHGYYTRYASANQEKALHYDVSFGQSKWGSLTSITAVDYDDLRTGARRDDRFPEFGRRSTIQSVDAQGNDIVEPNPDPNVQVGTGYQQLDLLQKFLFVPSPQHRVTINMQYSTSSDVPRYDNLSEIRDGQLRWADWYYGPQKRLMAAIDYRNLCATRLYDQLTVIGAYQRIDEDRISRRFGSSSELTQNEGVDVWSWTMDASKYLGEEHHWSLQYGADLQSNDVNSQAYQTDIQSGAISTDVLTRYANDQNQLTNLGAYLYTKGRLSDGLHLSGGLRYSRSAYDIRYEQTPIVTYPDSFYEGVNGENSALTGSIGANWHVTPQLQVRTMLSTAFRSPNIDDLSKVRVNGDEISFPNVDLRPEKSKNAELTIAYEGTDDLKVSVTGFYTHLTDAITRKPFTLSDGSDTWMTQGETLAIVANQNVQTARIMGISTNISGQIGEHYRYYGSLNLTRGDEIVDGEVAAPFAHIPPTYGKVGVEYNRDRWSIKAISRYNLHKPLSRYGGSVDNPDLASSDGALAWTTYNLYTNYQVSEAVELSLAIENILDKHYRPFASGVSAPGRNLILSFRGRL